MKQALLRNGRVEVVEVPSPLVEDGGVLVAAEYSCISVGTEMTRLRVSGVPLWRRALQEPGKVAWVFDNLRTRGLARTRQVVDERLSTARPIGYSAAGRVIGVGTRVETFAIGERVACAGGQCAHHAEVISVPVNLAVQVPDGVTATAASTVGLGAIALQGVRRASPTLGEVFVVIGLGVLGQITVQLLKSNGCKVLGLDLDQDRTSLALGHGMDLPVNPLEDPPSLRVACLTNGVGADGVIITAASPSNEVLSSAFQMCRRKGRVVLVGDVGLDINRSDIFAKELDFFISTSYGPGRFDARFEEHGLDYPISYVRWTETRNMQAYLDLIQAGALKIDPLVTDVFPIERAAEAYQFLGSPTRKAVAALLSYQTQPTRSTDLRVLKPQVPRSERVRVALVGAGSFMKATHLPNIRALATQYEVGAVVSRSGHNAAETGRLAGASWVSTDFQRVLAEPDIDAVIIATRHNLHGSQSLAALKAGKHVLCEKPLVLTREELEDIKSYYSAVPEGRSAPVLLTGFNRRFSPYATKMRAFLSTRSHPVLITYRMCGSHASPDHWIHGPEGGGRNMAEACHVYDLFGFLVGHRVASVVAVPIRHGTDWFGPRENFSVTVSFEDGSVASLVYTTMGSREHPKEQCEVFSEGRTIVLNDYQDLRFSGTKAKRLTTPTGEKGHYEELQAFATAILAGGRWPIPLWQQIQAMEIAIEVEAQLLPGDV